APCAAPAPADDPDGSGATCAAPIVTEDANNAVLKMSFNILRFSPLGGSWSKTSREGHRSGFRFKCRGSRFKAEFRIRMGTSFCRRRLIFSRSLRRRWDFTKRNETRGDEM